MDKDLRLLVCPFADHEIVKCVNDGSTNKDCPTGALTVGKHYMVIEWLKGSNCIVILDNKKQRIAFTFDRFTHTTDSA